MNPQGEEVVEDGCVLGVCGGGGGCSYSYPFFPCTDPLPNPKTVPTLGMESAPFPVLLRHVLWAVLTTIV